MKPNREDNWTTIRFETYLCPTNEYFNGGCVSCYSDWKTAPSSQGFDMASYVYLFQLSDEDLKDFHQYGCNSCSGIGKRLKTRTLESGCRIDNPSLQLEETCGYPCTRVGSSGRSADQAYTLLWSELQKTITRGSNVTFLSKLLSYPSIGYVGITLPESSPKKLNSFIHFFADIMSFEIKLHNCTNEKLSNVKGLIQSLVKEILFWEDITTTASTDSITIHSKTLNSVTITVVSSVVGIIFLILIIVLWYFMIVFRDLPDEIAWSFLLQKKYRWMYSYHYQSIN